jgi:hypothetical protein
MMIAIVCAAVIFAGVAAIHRNRQRRVALQVAQASYQSAVLVRKTAELAAVEYEHGIYK